ncbi:MAG: hypothetical protein KGM24_01475 [Elusimicrobia bacterium]|nr:hypothetical protein [Elusimicrobiota bacterium]
MTLTIGEEVVGAGSASTTRLARTGAREIFSAPGPVGDLAVRADVARTTMTLTWSTPGYDGTVGALQPGSSYYIRVASYTAPDTFSFAQAQVVVSTSGASPGTGVGDQLSGLDPNTTWYSVLWTVDSDGDASTGSVRAAGSTLADPPGVPASPFAEVDVTSAVVTWTGLPLSPSSATCEGYLVEASSTDFGALSPGGVISSSATTDPSQTTLTVSDPPLITGQQYWFRAGSLNWQGVANDAVLGSTTTLLQMQVPLPASPVYPSVSSDAITAAWQRNGNPHGTLYRLDGSLDPAFGTFSSSTTDQLSASTSTLSPDTTYYFRVRASSGAGVSAFADLGSTMTLRVPPAAPATFSGVAAHQLTLAWQNGGNPAGAPYAVVATTEAAVPYGDAGDVGLDTSPAGASPAATLTGLLPNTTYFVYVAALNQLGAPSVWLAAGSTLTPAALPLAASPAFADLASGGFTALWDPDGNPLSVTTYTVEVSTSPSFDPTASSVTFSTVPDAAAASFAGLNANTTYYFEARAQDFLGRPTAFASLGSTSTLPVSPLPASVVFGPTAPTASSLTLEWTDPNNGPGTGYRLNVSTDASFGNGAAVTTHTVYALQFSTSGLSADATYYLRVAALGNDGAPSAFVSAATATLTNVPAAASPAFAGVGESSMTVFWLPNGSPPSQTTYAVQASSASDFNSGVYDQVLLATAPAGPAPAATLTGLNPATTYYVRVAGLNWDGAPSAWLVLGATATLAQPPGSPAVSAVYLSSLTVSWTPSAADGYAVLASSTAFAAGTAVAYSSAAGGSLTSLTVSGLLANTTYTLRAQGLNWGGTAASADAGAQSTLAQAVSGAAVYQVFATSVTVNWRPAPASPQTATAEGYVLEAATAASVGSPSDFGGVIVSSLSWGIQPATLTVTGLYAGATYTLRVGALNWSGDANDATAGGAITQTSNFVWTAAVSGAWDTATNWTPNGIPSGGSQVTIDKSVTVTANGGAISFYTLTLGDAAGTYAPVLLLSTAVASGRNMTVYPNATFTQGVAQTQTFAGDVTFASGSTLNHSAIGTNPPAAEVNFSVGGTFTLSAGATIAVSGLGYNGGAVSGNGVISGAGGGNVGAVTTDGGSGGGHGGAGGTVGSEAGGLANDSATNPTAPGSGGAGGRVSAGATGGNGGGLVIVTADTMQIDGLIQADGAAGNAGDGTRTGRTAAGGGSGGGVNLSANYFVGSGTITALGGAGGADSNGNLNPGGGGGGGMVSINVITAGGACDVSVSTDGGPSGGGASLGGNGGTFSSTSTYQAPPDFSAVTSSTDSLLWTWSLEPHVKTYQVFASTGGPVSPVLGASAASYTESGLLPNTTYTRYVEVGGCGAAADSPSASRTTLAAPPSALAQSFTDVQDDRVSAAWQAKPASPPESSAEGYRVEASSTNFAGGVTVTSDTYDVAQSTLTLLYPPLDANTTYYFRVAAYDWAGELGPYVSLGSTPTLAVPPTRLSSDFLGVFAASATVQWAALPGSPQAATAEGFQVDASSTNFGALLPGGVVSSSATADVAQSTLTVSAPALAVNHRYYFRVASLNWNGSPNYTTLGSTITPFSMVPPSAADPAYAPVSANSITANWLVSGNPAGSLYELDCSTDPGFASYSSSSTYALSATTDTLSASTTYYFRVRSSSGPAASSFSVLPATMTWRLTPVSGAYPDVEAHQLSVSWQSGGNPGGIPYVLAVSTEASFPNADAGDVALTTSPAGTPLSATLTGTLPNTTYYAFVAALNPIGAPSAWLSVGAVLTPAAQPLSAASTFTLVGQTSATVVWDGDGDPLSITTYTVQLSTASDFNSGVYYQVSLDTAPDFLPPSATLNGLQADTTYYLRVLASDVRGRATAWTNLGSTATLAEVPSPSVAGVFLSSLTVSWTPVAAAGYALAASSTDFGAASPGGTVAFSSAAGGGTSSLSATGLDANTTWYLRLSALNVAGGATPAPELPRSTLAPPVSGAWIYQVFATSITANWQPAPGSPQSASAEGYALEAATTTDVATVSDFSGTIVSSISWSIQPATLTVSGLDAGATYSLRVGALNWSGDENDAPAGQAITSVTNFVWVGGSGAWATTTNWNPVGLPSNGSLVTIDKSVTVTASGSAIDFYGLTLGDPAGTFAPVLVMSTTIASGHDMTVEPGATFTQGVAQALDFKGDVTFAAGSTLNHSATGTSPQGADVNLSVAGTFTLAAGATAAVSGLGFNGGATNGGNGVVAFNGGGNGSSASSAGGSGGGHGGSGGAAGTNGGGAVNDSATNPVLVGSGGGGGDGTGGTGGKGGGAVIVAANTMQIDGLISADGAVGGTGPSGNTANCAGGGGSGGAVSLSAQYFTGIGTITALGGAGGTDADGGNDPGGGGGGGMVSISIGTSGDVCSLAISTAGGASGGGTSGAGGGGTFSSTSTYVAPTGFAGVSPTSTTILWTWNLASGGRTYQVFAATGGPVSPILGSTAAQYEETGLLANTTYARYVEVGGCGNGADSSQASLATLAAPPGTLAQPFPDVQTNALTAAWAAGSNEGYQVEASSTDFGTLSPGGVTVTSATFDAAQSTLTVAFPALDANTTYYVRVAALNWVGSLSSYTVLGATATLSPALSRLASDYLAVYFTSATLQWAALPAASASGYRLETSSSPFGSPTGTIYSSTTFDAAQSTLTVSGIDANTTWYMRVAALNRAGAANYTTLTPLDIQISPSMVLMDLGTLDPSVSRSTVSISSFVITNVGTLPVTFSLSASTATAGSPWILGSAPGIETAELQGLWNSAPPSAASFATPITPSTTTSGGFGGAYAGDQNGTSVPPGGSRTLWIRFTAPDTTVDISPQTFLLLVDPSFP